MGYQLSKKELVKEIIKSGKDPHYFINNYAKISHPIHGLIPFKTYDFQDNSLEDFNDYRFNVIHYYWRLYLLVDVVPSR